VLDPSHLAFLDSQRVARLATVDGDGRPHALPVCFAVLDGAIYTPIDEKPKRVAAGALRRVRNVEQRPAVCLVVDTYDENWARLAWLQVRGDAALVSDAAERARALAALRARYPQYVAMDLEARPLIRIVPRRVVAWAASGRLDPSAP
jgi:PPOX class probable F420-dependent enzyme